MAACLVLLVACEPAREPGIAEIARELRALRQGQSTAASTPVAPIDRAAIVEALSPLRDTLAGLASAQERLQQQQASLADELKRWANLVAQSATSGPKQELEAMQQRLSTFEQALQAQDARHRESEALLERALDATADRLDEFLRRVEALRGGGAAPAPAGTSAPEPARGAGTAGEPARTGMSRGGSRSPSPWWFGVLGIAALAGGWLGWRLLAAPAAVAGRGEGAVDQETAELWAAAAMLGDAVDRLRLVVGPGTPPAAAPVAVAAEPPRPEPVAAAVDAAPAATALPEFAEPEVEDDVFVLDDGLEGAEVAEPEPEAAPPPASVPAGPPWLLLRVGCQDTAAASCAAAELLAADPRVLRRPAPRIVPGPGRIEVEFAVLPALPPGDHDHLLGCLRAAIEAA